MLDRKMKRVAKRLQTYFAQSTCHGAENVGEDGEFHLVIPAIATIRAAGIKIPITVDTYRASIARKAVEAGADSINEVSAGLLDSEILSTVAELNAPICLIHMRGTPTAMNSLAVYNIDVIEEIAAQLEARVREAEQEELGLHWLVGPSRKRFVGTVTGVDKAGERHCGTAEAVAACVASGADIVMVHDVDEMKKVVIMAVAISRK
ncbi:trifunctional dihydropteroate synthetase [Rhizina undulata]